MERFILISMFFGSDSLPRMNAIHFSLVIWGSTFKTLSKQWSIKTDDGYQMFVSPFPSLQRSDGGIVQITVIDCCPPCPIYWKGALRQIVIKSLKIYWGKSAMKESGKRCIAEVSICFHFFSDKIVQLWMYSDVQDWMYNKQEYMGTYRAANSSRCKCIWCFFLFLMLCPAMLSYH